jgi:hypothetical protein
MRHFCFQRQYGKDKYNVSADSAITDSAVTPANATRKRNQDAENYLYI